MGRDWLLGLRSRKEHEAVSAAGQHVGMWLGRGVCDFLDREPPLPAPLAVGIVVESGGRGKLSPEPAPSPQWPFGAVTVTLTCGIYGQVLGRVRCGTSWA